MICCVISAYKARASVCVVVRKALAFVDIAIVIDDACPEHSGDAVQAEFASDERVIVLRHAENGGVGRATKTGFAKALELEASIVIKIDGDDQMDVSYIPGIVEIFERDPALAFVKGNRFYRAQVLNSMPRIRLIGNSMLSLLVKFSSGYWNLLDPTNGYIAFRCAALRELDWQSFANSYFFEISVICSLGLQQAQVAEVEMTANYGNENSSLSILKVLREFPPKLFGLYIRRILMQYFIFDVNLGTLNLLFGSVALVLGVALGCYEFAQTVTTHVARSAGTIMLAALPILMGFQLLLNALMYDVQFGPKSARYGPGRRTPLR
jgi:dolichol-phosphate mannosyltransferase